MSVATSRQSLPAVLAGRLRECGFSPFFGTPCGILGPLYDCLTEQFGLMTITREDNAVGVAAGTALSGQRPVVLMQNSGLGQSMNAIASLVSPYRLPILFVVSLRGTGQDQTEENQVMGRATEPLLASAGIPTRLLDGQEPDSHVVWASRLVIQENHPAALLVPPDIFGWRP